jgi:hypothetical protein
MLDNELTNSAWNAHAECVRSSSRISFAGRRAERGVEPWLPLCAASALGAMRKSGDGSDRIAARVPVRAAEAAPVANAPLKRLADGV